jgi:hypothetical protein
MQRKEKGEYKNLLLPDLEVEGDLALLWRYTLVSQPAEKQSPPCRSHRRDKPLHRCFP